MDRLDRNLVGLSHFSRPDYYDAAYADRTEDISFYRGIIGRNRILEMGVGNGRIAIPLARGGATVVGVDASAPMLADLKTKLRAEEPDVRKRVRVTRSDMQTFHTDARFDAVIAPFNTVLHLYTSRDALAFLKRARVHLRSGGFFVADLSIPHAADLARDPERAFRTRPVEFPGLGRVPYAEYFDYDPITQLLTVTMRFTPRKGKPFDQVLVHRQYFPQEWRALLVAAGFDIMHAWGDFHRGPLTRTSDVMIFAARKK